MKQDRILSYINVLPKEIDNISKLPIDYSGVQGAETLVTLHSAVKPVIAEESSPTTHT
jgi:hypothetical protein